jgi:hypothetical protein
LNAGDVNLYAYVYNRPLILSDPSGAIPLWDHFWFYYYAKKCGETGIQCANSLNGVNQSQEELERMAQEAFNREVGSVSALRFKAGYGDNYCRQMEEYGAHLYGDSFPTNVQRVDPNGSLVDTAKNIANRQRPSKLKRAWDW